MFNKYPIKVRVYKPLDGGGFTFYDDRAGRKKRKDGTEYFKLAKDKKAGNVPPIAFKNMIQTKKGFHVNVFSPNAGSYQPMVIKPMDTTYGPHLAVLGDDMRAWFANEIVWASDTFKKKQDFLTKYMPVVLVLLFGISLMLIMVGYGYFIEGAGKGLGGVAASLNSAAENLLHASGNLKQGGLVLPPS